MKVGDTNGKGEGLFADEDIKKCEYIIEYVGQIKYSHNGSIYNMEYSDIDLLIDGKGKKGNASKFINHSCNPNCILEQSSEA